MKILRFLIAGGLTTLFSLGLLYLFNSILHMHYLLASSLAFLGGVVSSYLFHKYWTFDNKKPEHVKQFGKHTMLATWNFGLNALLMFIFVGTLGLQPLIGQTATSGLIAIQSFIIYSRIIFI